MARSPWAALAGAALFVVVGCQPALRFPDEGWTGPPTPDLSVYYPLAQGDAQYHLVVTPTPKGPKPDVVFSEIYGWIGVKDGAVYMHRTVRRPDPSAQAPAPPIVAVDPPPKPGPGTEVTDRLLRRERHQLIAITKPRSGQGEAPSAEWGVLLEEPVVVGKRWRLLPNDPLVICRIAAIEDLELPLGRLTACARVETRLLPDPQKDAPGTSEYRMAETWYAPGLGPVAEVHYGDNGSLAGWWALIASRRPTDSEAKRCEDYMRRNPGGPPAGLRISPARSSSGP